LEDRVLSPLPPGFEVDANVLQNFPLGAIVIETAPSQSSFWTRTAKIDVMLPDNSKKSYFMKKMNMGERCYLGNLSR